MRETNVETLKCSLPDWTDWDVAGYFAGVALGLIDPECSPFPTDAKHVFWTDHPIGNLLHDLLEQLSSLGVLKRREEPDVQYRWSRAYRGTWERGS